MTIYRRWEIADLVLEIGPDIIRGNTFNLNLKLEQSSKGDEAERKYIFTKYDIQELNRVLVQALNDLDERDLYCLPTINTCSQLINS